MRDSLHGDSASPVKTVLTSDAQDMSDFQAVDNTPGFPARLIGTIISLWWLFVIIIGLAAISMPFLFPQWAKNYDDELKGLKTATSSVALLDVAKSIDWRAAFTKAHIKHLRYVGTGRHPIFKDNPALKKKWFYTGQALMMKTYVSDYDMMTPEERVVWKARNSKDALTFPAIGVEQVEAAEYCASLGKGHRLPSYSELVVASVSFTERNASSVAKALKPNLELTLFESKSLWTADPKPDDSWFPWFSSDSDDFRVFTPGVDDELYKDDGFDDGDLSFLCVREAN